MGQNSDKILIKGSVTVLQFAVSQSLNSCTTTILYGWKFRSLCKILLALQSDIPRATEYLMAEHLGLHMNDCLSVLWQSHYMHTAWWFLF
jgi:hypothetical protein